MGRFKRTDNSQGLFISVNLKEQLLPGTLEWTTDYFVDKMDLSLFEENRESLPREYNRESRKEKRTQPIRYTRRIW